MRTENYKHGVVSIFLVLALVFSMVTISAPLASAGDWVNNPAPGGTTIDVVQGDTFVIRHVLEFDQPEDGAYTVTMAWDCYDNEPDENFTFVDNSAYFISGASIGESIRADVSWLIVPSPDFPGSTRYILAVKCPATDKDPRNGEFNVDITLGAYGVGGVPHIPGDHVIIAHTAGVTVIEPGLKSWDRAAITIDVVGVGVTVDISPASDNGWTNDVLDYTVTVTNTGELADNYTLNLSDTGGWTLGISPGVLEIPAGNSDTATLSVTVGAGSTTVTVEADGVYADNTDTCTATQSTGPRVDVEVSPDYQEDLPGENLLYTVVVTNIGTVDDNYTVTFMEDAGWNVHFSVATIYPTDDTHVAEYYPDQAADSGGDYNMYVGWEVSPFQTEGWKTRAYLRFDVSSIPSGSIINSATFNAKVDYGPSAGYPTYAIDNMLTDVKAVSGDSWLENELTWSNAPAVGSTLDTTMVYDDTTVGRKVWYSWDVASFVTTEFAGDGVVSLCMLSENKEADNTDCTVWFYTKDANGDDPYLLVDYTYTPPGGYVVELAPGENDTRTMTVEIPIDAVPCTVDNVTVTAVSEVDPLVDDSETVEAHAEPAMIVGVYAEPDHQDGDINKKLSYSVIIANEGLAADNYEVTISDDLGWNPQFSVVTNVLPTDDVAICEGFPDYVEDSGVDYNTYNGWSATYLSQRPYFKFDISFIPPGSKLCGAILWANAKYGCAGPGYVDTTHLVDAMTVDNDSWDETTLTWNIAQASHPVGAVLDTENFMGDDIIGHPYHWYSWDVKSYVDNEYHDGEQLVTIALKRQDPENAYESSGWFYTKDAYVTQPRPYLEIRYLPGGDTTTQVELGAGENVTLHFGVIIPGWAIPSTTDTITITATSKTDPAVTGSDSVTAHAESTLRAVDAWIDGKDWQETHKDPLTYVINIHNTGLIADMYKITAYDLYGWPLYVEPQEVWLKPSHNAQVALSVTIPYQTPGCITDNIIVHIEGKLASGTFTDLDNSQTKVTVQAHSKVVYGVDVEVYPSIHQTGHPSSRLTWLVTVTNTGNVPDSYYLSLSQNVYDATGAPYPTWVPGLEQITVELEAGEEASILLNLDVPTDLRTGVHNDIEVTAVSQMAEVSTAKVTAQVRQQMPHVPQGEIKLQAVAGYVAIDIWPTYYDFKVFNETDIKSTYPEYFTIRNVGNVDVDVSIVGTDATSKPGEPAAKWTLGDGAIGIDTYAMWWTEDGVIVDTVTKDEKILIGTLVPSDETQFDITVQAPSTFTTPAKMWMKIKLTARKIHYT